MNANVLLDTSDFRIRAANPGAELSANTGELIEDLAAANARSDFNAFRRLIHPNTLIRGWWHEDAGRRLQRFWDSFKARKRPKLLLQAPPQHGKSMIITDFIAWIAGHDPDLALLFASYAESLGIRTNKALQRTFRSFQYRQIFSNTKIAGMGAPAGYRWTCNMDMVEFINFAGSFRNTTIEGQITGHSLNMGFVDDPMKGRADASSLLKREKAWDWLTDDFFTRFHEFAGFIMIGTRWHVDDPIGRWINANPDIEAVKYAAIAADRSDWTVKRGYRKVGDPLFPQWKSKDFLMERKNVQSQSSFESLYQQNPIIVGGGLFPIHKFNYVDDSNRVPYRDMVRSVRYWDKAGTEGGGAYTCGVFMHLLKDGRVLITDVQRGQWSALEREERIRKTAHADRSFCGLRRYEVWVEQEPGSGGKESAESTIRNLRGFRVFADKVTGSKRHSDDERSGKEIRAEPYAVQVQNGNVYLSEEIWVQAFLDEHETFPNGRYVDQVDAAAGAFNKLCIPESTYDTSAAWVGDYS